MGATEKLPRFRAICRQDDFQRPDWGVCDTHHEHETRWGYKCQGDAELAVNKLNGLTRLAADVRGTD